MFIGTDPEDAGPQGKFFGIWLETVLAGGLLCGSFFWLMTALQWGVVLSRTGGPRRKRFLWQFYVVPFFLR